MLIYHFGSRAGLMRAIVEDVERQQREFFARFVADLSVAPREAGLAFWQRVADPALANNVRLFFELYAQALQARPGTEGFLDHVVENWLEPLVEYGTRRGQSPEAARADARLGLAVTRGLLLDLVGTGNRAEVDVAYRRYLELSAPAAAAGANSRPGPQPAERARAAPLVRKPCSGLGHLA